MGQTPSQSVGKVNKTLTVSWILRKQKTTHNPNPEQPIKFQYKTRRKKLPEENRNQNKSNNNLLKECSANNLQKLNNFNKSNQSNVNNVKNTNVNEMKCRIRKTENITVRTKSEPNLVHDRIREKHKHRRKLRVKSDWGKHVQQFGYDIQDVELFLTKATIEKPANIPVVLALPSVLYQTRIGGYQAEISLPLGMVVNAVFKNQHWLYVQTPHAEEGYIHYAACLPLGIIPPPEDDIPTPCWEKCTDVFPKPSGNMTDTEKLSSQSDYGGDVSSCYNRRSRNVPSTCGEKTVDSLYLRAASTKAKNIRQTLLVITTNYAGSESNSLGVSKGEVVFLVATPLTGWFWVRNKEGHEGFIPAAIAGHGFL